MVDTPCATVVSDEGAIRHAFVDYAFARFTEQLADKRFDDVAPEIAKLLDQVTNVSGRTLSYYIDREKRAKVSEQTYGEADRNSS
jgi:hypothetical protein